MTYQLEIKTEARSDIIDTARWCFRKNDIRKFPFVIVYEIFTDAIVVYEDFHNCQNTKRKIKRLRR